MNRRSLLRGLLALPLAPLVARVLPKFRPRLSIMPGGQMLDLARGSDQTSIWTVEWYGESPGRRAVEDSKFLRAMADDLESRFFYDGYPVRALTYPQLSVQEKIRRATRNAVGRT